MDAAAADDDAAGPYTALAPEGFDVEDAEDAGDAPAPLLGWAAAGATRRGERSSAGRALLRRLPPPEALLALIAALLALVVVLLGVDVRHSAPAPLTPPGDGALTPPAPPPPAPAPGAPAPRTAWEAHLAGAGYLRTASFVSLWWQRQGNNLLLEVPHSALGTLVLVNAEVSAADGAAYLLRQPLGDAYWQLAASPDGQSLDVVVPPLAAARVSPRSTVAPAARDGGLFAGWAYTLARYDAGGAIGTRDAAAPAGSAASAFYLANHLLMARFGLADVLDELDVAELEDARLAAAAGHPRNLELDIQGRANGTGVGVHLSLSAAPAVPMAPRLADERAGFFSTCFAALGAEPGAGPQQALGSQDARRCVAHRWRLLRSPTSPRGCGPPPAPPCVAAVPITYHLDPSIPDKWAPCFRHGVTAWDAAFALAGWAPGTIRALRPGEPGWPSDYSASDVRYASVTFAPSLASVYAVGPSTVDPRSGEILDADIMFAHAWVAWFLGEWHGLAGKGGLTAESGGDVHEGAQSSAQQHAAAHGGYARVHRAPRASSQCFHHHGPAQAGGSGAGALFRAAAAAAGSGASASSAAAAVADAPPLSPFARVPADSSDAFVCEALAEVVAHEVGHTLGLRHNFAGSAAWSAAQLSNASHVAAHGTAASVMDYLPPVMPANRSAQAYYFSPVVGPYDRWAIAVGYAPAEAEQAAEQAAAAAGAAAADADVAVVPAAVPAEAAALLAQAGRRELSFCTDDDDPSPSGTDARCSTYDLTDDAVSYFRDRTALATAAAAAALDAAVAPPAPGDFADVWPLVHTVLHTSSVSVAAAGRYAAKQLGSAAVSRGRHGQLAAPVAPASPAAQRDALSFLAQLLTGDALYVRRADADAMTLRGWRSGSAWGADDDALGRMPAPVVAEARAAKRAILQAALAPWRADAMARAAWAAGAASGDADVEADARAVEAAEVADTLGTAVWGSALSAAARRSSSSSSSGGNVCASDELLSAAAAELRAHDGERRALQRMWLQALKDAAAPGAAAGDGAAAAVAARAEAAAALACVQALVARSSADADVAARALKLHLLALLSY